MTSAGMALPRAALVGNPSDGYCGRTIAFTFGDFSARVTLNDAADLSIPEEGAALLGAALEVFNSYCEKADRHVGEVNVAMAYESDIPYKLGLGGSSAIVIACLRALADYFEMEIAREVMADLALEAERDLLGIPAGLQDRVVQSFEGLVYMDFDQALVDARGFGEYLALDGAALPPLFVAYMPEAAEGSEVTHSELRSRYEARDPKVLAAIEEWKDLTEQVRALLEAGKGAEIGPYLSRNFAIRRELGLAGTGTIAMAQAASALGASANSAGSGGAIVGTYDGPEMFSRLAETLSGLGASVITPSVSPLQLPGQSKPLTNR